MSVHYCIHNSQVRFTRFPVAVRHLLPHLSSFTLTTIHNHYSSLTVALCVTTIIRFVANIHATRHHAIVNELLLNVQCHSTVINIEYYFHTIMYACML